MSRRIPSVMSKFSERLVKTEMAARRSGKAPHLQMWSSPIDRSGPTETCHPVSTNYYFQFLFLRKNQKFR